MTLKKFLKSIFIFSLIILPSLLVFSACEKNNQKENGDKKPKIEYCFFTIQEKPEDIELFDVSEISYQTDKNGRMFCEKGQTIQINLKLFLGYRIGTIQVKVGEQVIDLTQNEENGVYFSGEYTCKSNFHISISGNPEAISHNFKVWCNLYGSGSSNISNDVFIKIDNFETLGLEKSTFKFSEFYSITTENEKQEHEISPDTILTFFIYAKSKDYKLSISEETFLALSDSSINLKILGIIGDIEPFVDEENGYYGYKQTARIFEDSLLTISYKPTTSNYLELKASETSSIQTAKPIFSPELFKVTINEKNIVDNNFFTEIKLSDFNGQDTLKIKIDFLKYSNQTFKNFYDNLTFTDHGNKIQTTNSSDGSSLEIELPRYYNFENKEKEKSTFIIYTNMIDLLEAENKLTENNMSIVFDCIHDQTTFASACVSDRNAYVGTKTDKGNNISLYLKNSKLIYELNGQSAENQFTFARIGDLIIEIGDKTNSQISITVEKQDVGDPTLNIVKYLISFSPEFNFESITFFHENPNTQA